MQRRIVACYRCEIFFHAVFLTNVLKRSFIHLVVCLTTGPKPLPKRSVHIVRPRASSFRCEYPLLSFRSSSRFLRLLPPLPVTSIPPFVYPSIPCRRRQFLRKMWPIQLTFRLLIPCRIFLCSLTLSNTISFVTWSVKLVFSILLQHYNSKLFRYILKRYPISNLFWFIETLELLYTTLQIISSPFLQLNTVTGINICSICFTISYCIVTSAVLWFCYDII
jgi:hypothetical protein